MKPDKKKEKIILDLYKQGLNYSEIFRKTGIGLQTTINCLRRNNLWKQSQFSIELVGSDSARCSKCSNISHINNFSFGRKDKHGTPQRFSYCNICRNARWKETRNKRFLHYRFADLKSRCKKYNIDLDITVEYLEYLFEMQEGKCFYTGLPLPTKQQKYGIEDNLSIDKVVPELGYVKGNVVLCLMRANTIKHNQTLEELKEWMSGWYDKLKKAGFVTTV